LGRAVDAIHLVQSEQIDPECSKALRLVALQRDAGGNLKANSDKIVA
jgi:hypothetical protein